MWSCPQAICKMLISIPFLFTEMQEKRLINYFLWFTKCSSILRGLFSQPSLSKESKESDKNEQSNHLYHIKSGIYMSNHQIFLHFKSEPETLKKKKIQFMSSWWNKIVGMVDWPDDCNTSHTCIGLMRNHSIRSDEKIFLHIYILELFSFINRIISHSHTRVIWYVPFGIYI